MPLDAKDMDINLVFKRNFEIKAKQLIKIIEANEGLDESFVDALIEKCPSTTKFIKLFALSETQTSTI